MREADHISVSRVGYAHHGIYIGRGHVIHYASSKYDKGRACIAREPIARFGPRAAIHVHDHDDCLAPREVIARATACLGERDYSLLTNNCEHFALWCKTGSLHSAQIELPMQLADRVPHLLQGTPAEVVAILVAAASIWKDLHECAALCKKHRRVRALLRMKTREIRRQERDKTRELCRSLLCARTELKLALKYDISRLRQTLARDRVRCERFRLERSRKARAIDTLADTLEEFRQRALRSGSDEDFDDYRFLLARFTEMLLLY